jgi:nucleotide-binding universal stress UspA family protein
MKIMVGYDGSNMSKRAFIAAQKRAKALNAELHLFASIGAGKGEQVKITRLQTGLREAEMLCTACGISCLTKMSEEKRPVAQDMMHYAQENKVDEIVIGLRKRSGLGKILFGAITRQLILEAPCPVLTVK